MRFLAGILLLAAALIFLSAVMKTGGRIAGLSPNALLRLTDTFLLATIAVILLGERKKEK